MKYLSQALIQHEEIEEDRRQLELFRSNPPHFLTVSAKD